MSEREFRVVYAGSERIHAPQLVAIALGCLCVGVAFTHVVARVAPSTRMQEAGFTESAMFAASDTPLDEPAADRVPATTPVSKAAAHPSGGSRWRHAGRHFHAGPVVYSGCERTDRGRAACPHDRALEASVWRALRLLASCYTATPESGHAELHVTVHPNRQLEIALAAPTHGRSLNLRAVGQCAVPRLSKLRSHLKLDRTRITFRFGLS